MTKNQYDLMVFVCRQGLGNCSNCTLSAKHCFKYYMLDIVFDFPNRSYDCLTINERVAVQKKKFLRII